ncbi:conserved membrane hypothetical protein [Flavobacterium sp. 9AF]|nr:conserved membrane hypothetical protein [Flavobacterium sp. 9AF]
MYNNLLLFAELLGLIPIILFYRGKKNDKFTIFFLPFIWLVALSSVYELIFTLYLEVGTKIWFRINIFLEFYCVLFFYYNIFKNKRLFISIGVIYLFLYGYLLLDWSPKQKDFNDLLLNVSITLLVVFSSLKWFLDVFKKMEDIPLFQRTDFLYVSGLLIYFTGTFFVFLAADYLRDNPNYKLLEFWILIIIFNIILRLILIFSIWRVQTKLEQ